MTSYHVTTTRVLVPGSPLLRHRIRIAGRGEGPDNLKKRTLKKILTHLEVRGLLFLTLASQSAVLGSEGRQHLETCF